MKSIRKGAKRSIFLAAAEAVFNAHNKGKTDSDLWCCNALDRGRSLGDSSKEVGMFRYYFDPGFEVEISGGWWEIDECEPRVIALLLCAEMLRR
jgi:hypothetical protein